MNGALERQDTRVLFSVLPGGASLYLGFMAPEGNCRSLFLQKLLGFTPFFSQRVTLVRWTFCTRAQWPEIQEERDEYFSLFGRESRVWEVSVFS